MRTWHLVTALAGLLAISLVTEASVSPPVSTEAGGAPAPQAPAAHGRPPLYFEANRGQTDARVRFLARCRGYTAFLTDTEAVFSPGGRDAGVIRMRFPGANDGRSLVGYGLLPGRSNYFVGDDRDAWVTDVPHYDTVVAANLYPGVDLRWRESDAGRLEYDFVVAPGADASAISLAFDDAPAPRIDGQGRLVVRLGSGLLRHGRPIVYQDAGGRRRRVDGRFVQRDDCIGFEVSGYDRRLPLVIDPELTYSTYLGGTGDDWGIGIAVDGKGSAYVAGQTTSVDFPVKSAAQGSQKGSIDVFVTKYAADGKALAYSTYVGGTDRDEGRGITVDGSGAAYVVGRTNSTDFPLASALQSTHGGGSIDAFSLKLAPNGASLTYSTYLGGGGTDIAREVAVDGKGVAHVAGETTSTDFPTKSALYGTHGGGGLDGFVLKVAANGASLAYSTYFGGSSSDQAWGIAVDGGGATYVAGTTASSDFPTKIALQATHSGGTNDVFVAKFNAAGSALVYSTYFGGSGNDKGARGGLAIDGNGAVFVTGGTSSTDLPTKSALQGTHGGGTNDAFVTKLSTGGTTLVYSTYLGGSGDDAGRTVRVDAGGASHVTGVTASTDFPTKNAVQASNGGGAGDAFVAKLTAAGTALDYSTYLGGSGVEALSDLALDSSGYAYVAGRTTSTDLPTKSPEQGSYGGGQHDSWVTKIGPAVPPPRKPSALTITGSTEQRVDLAWKDESTDETRFELERKTEGGAFEALIEPAANATTHADESVAAVTTYTYRVRAVGAGGQSGWSNEAPVVTINSPDQLTATVVSNTRVDLMWRDRSTAEDGFDIERKRAGEDYAAISSVSADVTLLADTGVERDTTLFYRVRGTKGGAPTGWSNVAEVTTPPADPTDVVPSNNADGEVRIRWKDLSEAETGFEVERGLGCPPASYSLVATVGPNVTEFVDRSAVPETTYSYRVRAVNDHGHSEYTAPVCITTPPVAPSGLAGDALSPSRVRLTWSDNSGIEKGYEVQRTPTGRDEWADIADLPADASEYLDVGVSQEAAFSYRVRAYDANGRSRNAMAEGVSTPAALVVRAAKLAIPRGRAAKRRKPTLVARGEMDIGGTQVDFEGAATLWIGDTQIAISEFRSLRRGRLLRYDEDGIRLDLKPSAKGASRVPFALRVVGDVAAALEKDGKLFLRFKSGAFDAMGVVTLAGGAFNPARGKGTWIDPELNLLSVAATPKRKSFKMRATFPPGELPDTAPEVSVLLDIFEISFEPGAFKKRGATKYVLVRKLGPVRQKVILDYRRGTLSITLGGVALQTYEPGTVLVPLAVSIGTTQLQDKPLLVVTRRSFRY